MSSTPTKLLWCAALVEFSASTTLVILALSIDNICSVFQYRVNAIRRYEADVFYNPRIHTLPLLLGKLAS